MLVSREESLLSFLLPGSYLIPRLPPGALESLPLPFQFSFFVPLEVQGLALDIGRVPKLGTVTGRKVGSSEVLRDGRRQALLQVGSSGLISAFSDRLSI